MSKKKNRNLAGAGIPTLDLSVGNYEHNVPDHLNLNMHIEWKLKGAEAEHVGPLKAFAIENGMLKVLNRNAPIVYNYPIAEVKRAYMMPIELS